MVSVSGSVGRVGARVRALLIQHTYESPGKDRSTRMFVCVCVRVWGLLSIMRTGL